MLRKTMITAAAATALAIGSFATPALAQHHGFHHHGFGWGPAVGLGIGLGLAAPHYGYGYAWDDCYPVTRRVMTPWGWRVRTVCE